MQQSFLKLAPQIPDLIGTNDLCLVATDRTKYVYVNDMTGLFSYLTVGSSFGNIASPVKALQSGSPSDVVEEDEAGHKIRSLYYPTDEGTIGIIYNYESRSLVHNSIEQLNAGGTQMEGAANSISALSTSLQRSIASLKETATDTYQRNKSLLKNVQTVKEIVQQLQILRLNSSIEAARAGEQGKKFMVVADQVHSLAVEGEKRVNDINKLLQNVSSQLLSLRESVDGVSGTMMDQVVSGEKLSSMSELVGKAISTLNDRANRFQ